MFALFVRIQSGLFATYAGKGNCQSDNIYIPGQQEASGDVAHDELPKKPRAAEDLLAPSEECRQHEKTSIQNRHCACNSRTKTAHANRSQHKADRDIQLTTPV